MTARVPYGRFQQHRGDALAAEVAGDEETGDRPDRRGVDRSEDAAGLESRIRIARYDRAPTDRPVSLVRQQAGRSARSDDGAKLPLVPGSFAADEVASRQLPPHAPASTAGAVGAEQPPEIGPALRRHQNDVHAGAHRPAR